MKELQGQFKTDFEKWLIRHEINQDIVNIDDINNCFSRDLEDIFYNLPICAQFGILQLFADEIEFFNKERILPIVSKAYDCFYVDHRGCFKSFNTRPEAQQEAITQFEKWYNENK